MSWIIVLTICGVGPGGFICHSFTPPLFFPSREVCDTTVTMAKGVALQSVPESVVVHFTNGDCLNIGAGA